MAYLGFNYIFKKFKFDDLKLASPGLQNDIRNRFYNIEQLCNKNLINQNHDIFFTYCNKFL